MSHCYRCGYDDDSNGNGNGDNVYADLVFAAMDIQKGRKKERQKKIQKKIKWKYFRKALITQCDNDNHNRNDDGVSVGVGNDDERVEKTIMKCKFR